MGDADSVAVARVRSSGRVAWWKPVFLGAFFGGCGFIGARVVVAVDATRSRVDALEASRAADVARLERIESKVDDLLWRATTSK